MLRKIMTEELIIEASKHEEIELTCLWPAVREHVASGEQLADRGICAELEIAALLAGLDKLDASQPEFEDLLSQFTQIGREHFELEERQVWPRLRAAISSGALARQGRRRAGPQDRAGQAVRARAALPAGLGSLPGVLAEFSGKRESAARLQLTIRFVVLTGYSQTGPGRLRLDERPGRPRPKA